MQHIYISALQKGITVSRASNYRDIDKKKRIYFTEIKKAATHPEHNVLAV